MKTIYLSLLAMIIGLNVVNAQNQKVDCVVTKTDTIFCGKLRVGDFNTRCFMQDGEKIKIPNGDIIRYSQNGRVFQKLPIYVDNQKTNCFRMMELIECKNLVRVYKEERFNGMKDCLDAYFYYYIQDKCVNIQQNPDLDQITAFLQSYGDNNKQNLAQVPGQN